MAVYSADVFRLGVVALTAAGALPANPVWEVARITGESINFVPNTTTSNELDPSGQVRDSILTGAQTTGNIEMEVSRNNFLELVMAAVFRNDWGVGNKGSGTLPVTPAPVAAGELIPAKALKQYVLEKTFFKPTGSTLEDAYHTFVPTVFDSLSISIAPNAPI